MQKEHDEQFQWVELDKRMVIQVLLAEVVRLKNGSSVPICIFYNSCEGS